MIALRSFARGAFATDTGCRGSIITAVALNPARLAAFADGLLALLTFSIAGNKAWDCRDLALGQTVFWMSLAGLAAARMFAALFGLFGVDRLVRTEDGLFRERTLFGVGTRVAIE